MLGALRALFIPKPPAAVNATYIALVAAARNPFFFTELAVPDTLDGRFELITLHLFLLQDRILFLEGSLAPHAALPPAANGSLTLRAASTKTEQADRKEREQFAQFLSEAFFSDLDANLREMGVADTGVSHRIKKMGKAYHGRLQAYAAALNDDTALRAALARNLYGTVAEGDVGVLTRMAAYVKTMKNALATIPVATFMQGDYTWPEPSNSAL